MTASEDDEMRERRCIVTGDVLPESQLVRFVADPDGNVVPDLAAKLPGRGLWVKAERAILERAVAKNHFSKAAKAPLRTDADLIARVERLLVERMQGDLGIARRAGALFVGFDNVVRALEAKKAPVALIEARDGAADGKRKLWGAARSRGMELPVIDGLSSAELSLALGRENVIHAALTGGRLAERLIFEAGRLRGFRPAPESIESTRRPKGRLGRERNE
ncbi:MAG TPA: RNA-binding protein [Rhizomicrobium sp.]|jgi:hypothetical protein|nr:RNA-binding protein [Rhizomicrobium sp.]